MISIIQYRGTFIGIWLSHWCYFNVDIEGSSRLPCPGTVLSFHMLLLREQFANVAKLGALSDCVPSSNPRRFLQTPGVHIKQSLCPNFEEPTPLGITLLWRLQQQGQRQWHSQQWQCGNAGSANGSHNHSSRAAAVASCYCIISIISSF